MARRAVLAVVVVSFALTLGLSLYLQFAERRPPGPVNRTAAAFDSYDDFSWPSPPAAAVATAVLPQPTPAPSTAPVVRIKAPSIGIDAPIVTLGLDGKGIMENPPDPVSVAWYDFSAQPGYTGNVVLAGHVDYHDYGPAVFWNLRKLVVGDRVTVALQDGANYTYQVTSLVYYDAASAPVDERVNVVE